MGVCYDGCQPPCSYGCELRQKGVGVSPSAMPSRMNGNPPAKANPVWEKTVVTQKRPGGCEMPILKPGSSTVPLRVKEYGQKRREIQAGLRQLHHS